MRKKILKLTYNKTLSTNIYLFGHDPRVIMLAGMHGNEKSGVIILKQLVNQLASSSKKFDLAIIPCVNPNAYRANTRTNPADNLDMNRLFPAKQHNTSESVQIAQVLQDFVKKFEVIIDLHTFAKRRTLISGIELGTGKNAVRNRVRDIMSFLGLDNICRIDHVHEPKKDGSLCAYLQTAGKLAFGIELPDHSVLTRKQSQNIIRGLIRLARAYPTIPVKQTLPIYSRQIITAQQHGLFVPGVKLGQMIKRGQAIGRIVSRADGSQTIRSPFSGPIMSVSYKRAARPGEKIVVVGKKL